jgi:hypothetical protein
MAGFLLLLFLLLLLLLDLLFLLLLNELVLSTLKFSSVRNCLEHLDLGVLVFSAPKFASLFGFADSHMLDGSLVSPR